MYLIDNLSIKASSAAPSSLPRNKKGRIAVTGVPCGRPGQESHRVGDGGKSVTSQMFTGAFSQRFS